MTTVGFTTRIPWSPEKGFDLLADVTRNGEWSPAFTGAERTTAERVALGTAYRTTARGLGPTTIRVEQYDRPARLGFVAQAGPADTEHAFTLTPPATAPESPSASAYMPREPDGSWRR